ncbi:MAG: TetR/AcrR family transcriptional regulator [Anaerolineales bacterium]
MTRDEILDAAALIFREKGYHATSMRDIAQAVELKKGSLYHHVSSKQDILLALLDRALDLIIEDLEAVTVRELPPEEKLHQAMKAYLEFLTEHLSLSSVLLLEHRSLEPKFHKAHIPRRDHVESIWRAMIDEGIRQGVFRPVDSAQATKTLLGSLNWTVTWYRHDGPLSPLEIADQCADLYLAGLLKCE